MEEHQCTIFCLPKTEAFSALVSSDCCPIPDLVNAIHTFFWPLIVCQLFEYSTFTDRTCHKQLINLLVLLTGPKIKGSTFILFCKCSTTNISICHINQSDKHTLTCSTFSASFLLFLLNVFMY